MNIDILLGSTPCTVYSAGGGVHTYRSVEGFIATRTAMHHMDHGRDEIQPSVVFVASTSHDVCRTPGWGTLPENMGNHTSSVFFAQMNIPVEDVVTLCDEMEGRNTAPIIFVPISPARNTGAENGCDELHTSTLGKTPPGRNSILTTVDQWRLREADGVLTAVVRDVCHLEEKISGYHPSATVIRDLVDTCIPCGEDTVYSSDMWSRIEGKIDTIVNNDILFHDVLFLLTRVASFRYLRKHAPDVITDRINTTKEKRARFTAQVITRRTSRELDTILDCVDVSLHEQVTSMDSLLWCIRREHGPSLGVFTQVWYDIVQSQDNLADVAYLGCVTPLAVLVSCTASDERLRHLFDITPQGEHAPTREKKIDDMYAVAYDNDTADCFLPYWWGQQP